MICGFFTTKSLWTADNKRHQPRNSVQSFAVYVFGQAAAVKRLKKTPPHMDQRKVETETQTSVEGRTQVSNCSNTDVMKWVQIQ